MKRKGKIMKIMKAKNKNLTNQNPKTKQHLCRSVLSRHVLCCSEKKKAKQKTKSKIKIQNQNPKAKSKSNVYSNNIYKQLHICDDKTKRKRFSHLFLSKCRLFIFMVA